MIICPQCQTINEVQTTRCVSCGTALLAGEPMLDDDPFVGRIFGGRFQLLARLGSGEIGMVYRGLDRQSGQEAVLKIVHPDVAATIGEELLRSARQLAKLRHPKIATVLGAARESDGTLFIASDHVRGQTLKALLEANGPLGPRRAADILFQLCSALAPIHRLGRPHANLKPENVFLVEREGGQDFVQIVDVGVPELYGVRQAPEGQVVIGTPKYFSPEQASGRPVGLPSDQFTLGVIGYQLLTGALPFFGATPDQLLAAIVGTMPTPVSKRTAGVVLPPRLESIVERCLAKEPAQRYADLRALATELAEVIKSTQAEAPRRPKRGFVNASTVVAGPEALSDLLDDDDDDDASDGTLQREPPPATSLGDDRTPNVPPPLSALSRSATTARPAPRSAPPPPTQDDLASIPAPLMVTGAIDSDDLAMALAAASASVDAGGGAAPANGRRLDADLDAALAAALADVGAADEPPSRGPKADPFAGVSLDEVPSSAAGSAAAEAAAQAPRPPASARLTTEIMSAIDEELDDAPVGGPSKVSPLATAADLAALAPAVGARDSRNDAGPRRRPARSSNTGMVAALAILLLAGCGAAVWWFVLREEPPAPARPMAAASKGPPPSVAAADPPSTGQPPSAADVAPGSVAAAPGTAAAAEDKPASIRAFEEEQRLKEGEAARVAAAAALVTVHLETTPAGAQVKCGDADVGVTPTDHKYDPAKPCDYTFTLEGHEPAKRAFADAKAPVEGATPELSVSLSKALVAKGPEKPAGGATQKKPEGGAAPDKRNEQRPKPPRPPKPPKPDPDKLKDPFAD